jgi:type IV pilus assembly protein PilW
LAVSNVAATECVDSAGTVTSPSPECGSGTLAYGGNGTTIAPNDFVMVSTCGTGDVFQTTSGNNSLSHAAALAAAYGNDAVVSRATFVRYYVGVNNGEPALYREENDSATNTLKEITLLPGVENLQITYGVDTNSDGVADSYLSAGAAGLQTADDWAKVVNVRIGIVVRSQAANAMEQDTIARTVNGTNMKLDTNGMLVDAAGAAAAANDNRRRRTMETTIMLRNRFKPINFGG